MDRSVKACAWEKYLKAVWFYNRQVIVYRKAVPVLSRDFFYAFIVEADVSF